MKSPTIRIVGPKEMSSVARNPRPSSIGRALTCTFFSNSSVASPSCSANAGRTVSNCFFGPFFSNVVFLANLPWMTSLRALTSVTLPASTCARKNV